MKIVALYDEKCILCQETKKWCKRLDWFRRIQWLSLQEYEKEKHDYTFSSRELRKELHLILHTGEIYKGFFAVRKMMIQFPATFIFGVACYIPLMKKPGSAMYKWIAKNRYRWMRKKCSDGSCSL
ncbi:MAG: DUF393 domain-containing protein [Bacillota bacterium]|nr:DUF393 domain-containing protein [Bacillota bacterium]